MDTTVYLSQHKDLTLQIKKDYDRLRSLRLSLNQIPSASVCTDPVQVSLRENAQYVDRLVEIDRLETAIRKKEELAVRLENQIKAALNRLRLSGIKNGNDLADLLQYYFIFHKEWSEAGESMNISIATVYRWRRTALETFPLPPDPICVTDEVAEILAA